MNNLQNSGGFCFRCAAPAADSHADTQKLSRNEQLVPLQNPWPFLAANPDIDQSRIHPLLRTIYYPGKVLEIGRSYNEATKWWYTPKAVLTEKDIELYRENFIYNHEYHHLTDMDWTPAKDLARLILACCYERIDTLLHENLDRHNLMALWEEIEAYSQELRQIEERIEFTEELFANALTIYTFKAHMDAGFFGDMKTLQDIKEEILSSQESVFPGMREAHEAIMTLLERWFANYTFHHYIALLEPIEVSATEAGGVGFMRAGNGYENLMEILDQPFNKNYLELQEADAKTYAQEAEKYHDYMEKKINELYPRWQNILATLIHHAWNEVRNPRKMPEFVTSLWIISHGDVPSEGKYSAAPDQARKIMLKTMDYLDTNLNAEPHLFASLNWSINEKGQAFIESTVVHDSSHASHEEALKLLLLYEGLRQQLLAKKGLVCPLNNGSDYCRCSRQLRNRLERLYHLAKDELFGADELSDWKPLPCHYSDLWLPSWRSS
jgi:hypothetical protein